MYAPDSDSTIRWRGVEVPHAPAPLYGYVYLIHFHTPYKHAEHYLGSCVDLNERLARHRAGNGARLMEVITQAGITWHVSRIWRCESPEAARLLEKRLKHWHSAQRVDIRHPTRRPSPTLATILFTCSTSQAAGSP